MKEKFNESSFLDCPLINLNVSEAFLKTSEILGFKTIRQMVEPGWGKLLKMKGFDYDWFNELVKLLKARGMLSILEDRH